MLLAKAQNLNRRNVALCSLIDFGEGLNTSLLLIREPFNIGKGLLMHNARQIEFPSIEHRRRHRQEM